MAHLSFLVHCVTSPHINWIHSSHALFPPPSIYVVYSYLNCFQDNCLKGFTHVTLPFKLPTPLAKGHCGYSLINPLLSPFHLLLLYLRTFLPLQNIILATISRISKTCYPNVFQILSMELHQASCGNLWDTVGRISALWLLSAERWNKWFVVSPSVEFQPNQIIRQMLACPCEGQCHFFNLCTLLLCLGQGSWYVCHRFEISSIPLFQIPEH